MEGFFYVVPPVIFAFHFNLLINLRQHSKKLVRWLDHEIYEQDSHSDLLRPFIFNLWAKTHFKQHQQPVSRLNAAKAVCLLLFSIFPLGLLTFVMWRLADLQDGILTAFHVVWVLADIIALGYFWPKITNPAKRHINSYLLPLILLVFLLVIIRTKYASIAIHFPNKLDINNQFHSLVTPRLVVTNITLDKQDKDRVNGDKTEENKNQEQTENIEMTTINQCHNHVVYQQINLSKRNFNLIDLSGSTLCNVNFTKAKLKNANFKDATFSGKFNLADLRYANLYYTKFQQQTTFIDADLSHTDIRQSIINDADFTFAKLNNINIVGSEFIKSRFLQAQIESTTLIQTNLNKTEFVGANLKQSTFDDSILTNNDFRLVKGLNKRYFENGDIQHCTIDFQSIPNCYPNIDKNTLEEYWKIEIAKAIWNNSKCDMLYVPEKFKTTIGRKHYITEDNRTNLISRLIKANKLTNSSPLNLSMMGLTNISAQLLALSHITELNLSRNQLPHIPNSIKNLKRLQNLDLYNNKIVRIPDTISSLSQLEKLNLSFNKITQIPDTLTKFAQLQKLDLSFNQITQIPSTIANLKKLQNLYLYNNKITQIPNAIAKLKDLKNLDLYNNEIKQIPNAIANLKQLEKLDLYNNDISHIPDTISNLEHLQSLDLRSNNISFIPNSIANLTQLQQLDLRSNNITSNSQRY